MGYRPPRKVSEFIGVDLIKLNEMTLFHSIAVSDDVPLGILPLVSDEALERINEYGGVIPVLTEEILYESIGNVYESLAHKSSIQGVEFNEELNAEMEARSVRLSIRGFPAIVLYSFKVLRNGIMYVDQVELVDR
jgi:hypothetical protein